MRRTLIDSGGEKWWLLGRSGSDWKTKSSNLPRCIVTSRVSRHRIFKWQKGRFLPDSRVYAIASDSDCIFGLLTSKFHELWSLETCSWHGVGNDPTYNAESCFETFSFPEGLTPNIPAASYADDPRAQAIAAAASDLDLLRNNWLNPADLVRVEPEVVPGYPDRILPKDAAAAEVLKKRTLTNLYNERPAWLADAHRRLDAAVAAAYGWPTDLSDAQVLERLFALNQERAAVGR